MRQVCTVVCRWRPGDRFAVRMLALRDELASRSFDLPDAWWPDQPGVIGGRDHTAGGTWCCSDVASGVTAVVLNRPERGTAVPGAPSRGVLPLLGVRYRDGWAEHLELAGMASFALVVAGPESMAWWWFDGEDLHHQNLAAGTYMFTPRGLSNGPIDQRFLVAPVPSDPGSATLTEQMWSGWLDVVRDSVPSSDPNDLIVRTTTGDGSYETVFGQFIAARPGLLRLDYLDRPARSVTGEWTSRFWNSHRPA